MARLNSQVEPSPHYQWAAFAPSDWREIMVGKRTGFREQVIMMRPHR